MVAGDHYKYPGYSVVGLDRRKTKTPKNEKGRRESLKNRRDRKSSRYSAAGRSLEARVASILQRMAADGRIVSFELHPPNSPQDEMGMDFTVWALGSGDGIDERSFGISISANSTREGIAKHLDVPQLWIPINTKDETIVKKIL